MIKKTICILISVFCVIFLSACASLTNNEIPFESSAVQSTIKAETETKTDTLILRNVEIYADYAVLPLCDVITGLGFQLSWDADDRATFYCNEIQYLISISEKSLAETRENNNYLICAPGNDYFVCNVVDGTLMVDDNTIHSLFNTFIGYPISISVDREENTVVISKQ